ncbi:MAG TPA: hydrogenase subunit MbhD domain-containing protein [Patescibacteria group bacterium]|nr:hydrogenase subunit MbhD domain-containing protein [Patescibacteria group bacterium]
MNLAFDGLLVAALLWSAWRALATPDLGRGVVMFVVFGLLMALAWARLAAPDMALAEAALGAGLTGALLLDALGSQPGGHAKTATLKRLVVLATCTVLATGLLLVVLDAPLPALRLAAMVREHLAQSGVAHPVTAVLLNFRGYDTLLEVAVLLLAIVGILAVAPARRAGAARVPVDPVLAILARLLVPPMIVVAGYLLWAGAYRPGGAFQAAAVLAAAGVLLHLAGLIPAWVSPGRTLRSGFAGALLVFLAVAAALLVEGSLLQYPPEWAGELILLIEAALTLSLGVVLAGLFLLLSGRRAAA